jgi:hypothetical protein
MPAHLGVKNRLKLPPALIVGKLQNLLQRVPGGDVTWNDLKTLQEHNRLARENPSSSLSSYRNDVAKYGPNGQCTKVSPADWNTYLGPNGLVDKLVEMSFEFDKASKVTLITRKSSRSELKRVELTWSTGRIETIWARP